MFMKFIFCLLLVSLFACASKSPYEQRMEQIAEEREVQERIQLYKRKLTERCEGYGFKASTPEIAQCIDNAEKQDRVIWANQRNLEAERQRQLEKSTQQYLIDSTPGAGTKVCTQSSTGTYVCN
jgi:hypothetical protein